MDTQLQDQDYIMELLLLEIRQYSDFRKNDVNRGAVTKELAALIMEKYGYGIVASIRIIRMAGNINLDENIIIKEVEKLCITIDPDWKKNSDARWAARPVGISYANTENVTSDDSGVYSIIH